MKKRFFTKIGKDGAHTKLFYLIIDDENEELFEYFLSNGEMKETSDLMELLINGSVGLEEIDEVTALNLYAKDGVQDALIKIENQIN